LHPALRPARAAAPIAGQAADRPAGPAISARACRLRLLGLLLPVLVVLAGALGLAFRDAHDPPRSLPLQAAVGQVAQTEVGSPFATGTTAGGSEAPTEPVIVPQTPVERPAPPSPPAVTTAPQDWRAILRGLDARRNQAFQEGRADLLGEVYAAGSPAGAADRETLDGLVASGVHAVGLRLMVDQIDVLGSSETSARLRVVDHLPAYGLVDANGALVESRTARGPATWTVELRGSPAGWRIWSITPG
jgi:hypothetical protein